VLAGAVVTESIFSGRVWAVVHQSLEPIDPSVIMAFVLFMLRRWSWRNRRRSGLRLFDPRGATRRILMANVLTEDRGVVRLSEA